MTVGRFITLPLGAVIFGLVLVMRMAELQFTAEPSAIGTGQSHLWNEVLPAYRGNILDSQGEVLAGSLPRLSLVADPERLDATSDAFVQLAQILNERPSVLRKNVRQLEGGETIFLRRQLPVRLAESILGLKIDGLYPQFEYHRFYPEADVTAHVIGRTDGDGNALSGIERGLNAILSGANGAKKVVRDEFGWSRPDLEEIIPPQNGGSMQLAIDLRLQNHAHQELQKGIRAARAKSASVLMVDTDSGEIMTLVNLPSFDPNSSARSAFESYQNGIATNTFHPGEAIVPILLAAALDSKLIEGAKISRFSPAELVAAMSPKYLRATMLRLGFGSKTNINLTDEQTGLLPAATAIANILPSNSGASTDSFLATPLQLARAYTVFARQGELTDLSLLKRGTAMAKDANAPKQRVLDRQTTSQLLAMMRVRKERAALLTAQDPAKLIQFLGWGGDIAKSSRRTLRGTSRNQHGRVYIGMAPADDPKVIGVVVLRGAAVRVGKNSKHKSKPEPAEEIFTAVAELALHLLGVPPQPTQQSGQADVALSVAPAKGRSGVGERRATGRKGRLL